MAILYKELEHPWILVSVRGPGTKPPWISRDHNIGKGPVPWVGELTLTLNTVSSY